ncbi:MAG TPA: metal-dependent hydrolase [Saprospiraceae bacterium]|nr:metal-dependent hydrolase [Saprospiraceae bacterium]
MDSITQIVLAAGVGELILGRKLGNRAMVWGGIAGTIPDLDVLSSPFMTAAESLHAHRGFSHSIFFAMLAPLAYSYVLTKLYKNDFYLSRSWKNLVLICGILGCVLVGFLPTMIAVFSMDSFWKWPISLLGLGLGFVLFKRFWQHYYKDETPISHVTFKQWYIFFFWTTITHPILDCFTVYGTQLFAPISDIRISWDNISVADPLYTLLFGIPLVVGAFYKRSDKKRMVFTMLGIALSTMYMNATFFNKNHVKKVMTSSLKAQQTTYTRVMNNPSILNNILWSGTVETQDHFLLGQYSLFDKEAKMLFQEIPKNHHLLSEVKADDFDVNTIKWFSKGYYAAMYRKDGRLQVNDMRYGTFGGDGMGEDDYIFKFVLEKDSSGYYHIDPASQRPAGNNMQSAFKALFERLKGI